MVFKAILRPPLCEVYLAYTLYTHYLYTRHSLTHTQKLPKMAHKTKCKNYRASRRKHRRKIFETLG